MKIITKDLFEASYLLAMGMSLTHVFGENKTVLFQFEGKEELEVLKSKYDKGRAEVNIRRFRNSMNVVRDKLFITLEERQSAAAKY